MKVNLPPGIIKKVAEQIEQVNNWKVRDDVITALETKISHHNIIQEKCQKEIELQRAKEESERAKSLVEEKKVPVPKKSKILEKAQMMQHANL